MDRHRAARAILTVQLSSLCTLISVHSTGRPLAHCCCCETIIGDCQWRSGVRVENRFTLQGVGTPNLQCCELPLLRVRKYRPHVSCSNLFCSRGYASHVNGRQQPLSQRTQFWPTSRQNPMLSADALPMASAPAESPASLPMWRTAGAAAEDAQSVGRRSSAPRTVNRL